MPRLALAAVVVLLGAQGAQASSRPTIAFGRSGGNIQPFTVTISPSGRLSAQGPVKLSRPSVTISSDAVRGALALAKAEGFFRMRRTTACPGTLPDFASSFVTVGVRKVSVRGGCRRSFSELYAVLAAVAGVQ